jgi:asparagine synthase (glutamine-hydrolysing)
MCGIFGIVDLAARPKIDDAVLFSALGAMRHRGPDATDWRRISGTVVLGHARLSIIDLSASSNQPMIADDRYWLVFNGEIFNYVELRAELQALGVEFRTSGDSEVLLRAYIEWGERCVERFNGMWAFAIYDIVERTLFCSRDRYGEKPFNYAVRDGRFIFASEIKSLLACFPGLAEPDMEVIENYCRTSVGAQQSRTWFREVRRLQPGHNLTLRDSKLTTRRYWAYPFETNNRITFDEAREEYRRLFTDAVRIRMRSDVPLGVTLSAGIDSNSIAYSMQRLNPVPHHCFTSRFLGEGLVMDGSIYADGGRQIDESVTARKVTTALGLIPHVIETDYSSFVGDLSKIVWHLESGNSSPAVFPLMQLLFQARKHVTVVMDGQGADELLGGYVANIIWQGVIDSLAAGRFSEAWDSLREYGRTYKLPYSIKMMLRALSNQIPMLSKTYEATSGIGAAFGPALRGGTRILDYPDLDDKRGAGWVSEALRRQHTGGLVNLLHYGDAISMANSLESRMPFLDHRLVEFVWRLPASFKLRNGVGKYIHREAMRGIVPDWILNNKVKFGFNSPLAKQFRKGGAGPDDPASVLSSELCLQRGLFDRRGLSALITAHQTGKRDHGPLLFRMLSTELWFRTFIDRAPK